MDCRNCGMNARSVIVDWNNQGNSWHTSLKVVSLILSRLDDYLHVTIFCTNWYKIILRIFLIIITNV